MTPGQRCDEIIRLIDEAIGGPPAHAPDAGWDVPQPGPDRRRSQAAGAARRPVR
ncbi:MAG TPA: hypothetical protein VMV22_03625 [Acidimicrobiales bacterium]|nr:hypothetical protein [Acidimicrobiales bacterium]